MDRSTGDEFRAGWPVVLAALIGNAVGVHTLPPYTIGLFVDPLNAEFGWSRTTISLGITVITIGTAMAAPLFGLVVARFGERRLIGVSMMLLALGYFALSVMGSSPLTFFAIMAAMALLGSGCSPLTLSRLLVTRFDRARGTALGVALLGTGLTGAIAPLLLGPLLASAGWRAGYLAIGGVMLVALPVVVGLLFWSKAGGAARLASTIGKPLGERASLGTLASDGVFRRLLGVFFLVALAIGGVVVHFVPMLIDAGFDPADAARRASLIGVALIAGRLFSGLIIDRVFAPRVAAVSFALAAVGFAALLVGGHRLVVYAPLLVGLSLGVELDMIAYLGSRYFGGRRFGPGFGLLYAGFLLGVALSPVLYAIAHDEFGGYTPAFAAAACLLAAAAALAARLPRFPDAPQPA